MFGVRVGKGPSPLVGFNNNVKHRGRVFHVQTEDSGVTRPHIVTHLFADGGRILKSTRTDYSEYLGRTDMGQVVRTLMKEQHKAMFIALRDGQLDATIEGLLGPAPAPTEPTRVEDALPSSVLSVAPSTPRAAPPPASEVTASRVAPPLADAAAPPSSRAPAPRTLTELVLQDLEGARPAGAPPKPRGVTPALGTPAIPSARHGGPGSMGPKPSRYSAARPAAIFSSSPEPRSLFGGASISEQSLDEVILSYLAEDLDGAPDK